MKHRKIDAKIGERDSKEKRKEQRKGSAKEEQKR